MKPTSLGEVLHTLFYNMMYYIREVSHLHSFDALEKKKWPMSFEKFMKGCGNHKGPILEHKVLKQG